MAFLLGTNWEGRDERKKKRKREKRGRERPLVSLRMLNQGPNLMTHLTLITSIEALFPNTATLVANISKYEFGGDTNIQFITEAMALIDAPAITPAYSCVICPCHI